MNPDKQKELFKHVVCRFRVWTKRKCSGYVHGIVDKDRGLLPSPDMIERCKVGQVGNDPYAMCYLFGYADALGPDALVEPWCISNELILLKDFRWWEK